jgi:hypothetical protein
MVPKVGHNCIIALSCQDYGFVSTPFHIQHTVISAVLYVNRRNKEFGNSVWHCTVTSKHVMYGSKAQKFLVSAT